MFDIRQQPLNISEKLATLECGPQLVVTFARQLENGQKLEMHQHRRAQLVYSSEGLMRVTTESNCYLVPPQRAVWMPGGTAHAIEALSPISMCNLYIDPASAEHLKNEVRVLQVSPLLKALVQQMMSCPEGYGVDSKEARLAAVIIDQIEEQESINIVLPMPEDRRLRRIVQTLIDDPSDSRSLDEWANEAGASSRTLARLFVTETGMTFGQWRQQRRLHRALELLDAGEGITQISMALGYETISAFTAMFHRSMGMAPAAFRKASRNR